MKAFFEFRLHKLCGGPKFSGEGIGVDASGKAVKGVLGKIEIDNGDGMGGGVGEELGNEGTAGGGGEESEGEEGETAAEMGEEVKKRNGVTF